MSLPDYVRNRRAFLGFFGAGAGMLTALCGKLRADHAADRVPANLGDSSPVLAKLEAEFIRGQPLRDRLKAIGVEHRRLGAARDAALDSGDREEIERATRAWFDHIDNVSVPAAKPVDEHRKRLLAIMKEGGIDVAIVRGHAIVTLDEYGQDDDATIIGPDRIAGLGGKGGQA